MSNLGDLAYNLIGNSTSFVSANDRARASNDVLSGSVNSIIGQLNRQKKAMEDVGKTTLDFINSDKKASEESKEFARSLLAEVDALKRVSTERANYARSGTEIHSAKGYGGGPDFYGKRVRTPEEEAAIAARRTELAKTTGERIAADADRRDEAATIRRERRFNESQDRMMRRRAGQNAMDDTLWRDPARDAADDANVRRQMGEQGYDARWGKNKKGNQDPNSRNNFAAIEIGRAVEDFSQGSIYGGFKGGVLAASNNVSQAFVGMQSQFQDSKTKFGQMMANYGGLIGSAISTTLILGTTVVDVWMKSSRGANSAAEAARTYNDAIEKTVSNMQRLRALDRESQRVAAGPQGQMTAEEAQLKAKLDARQQLLDKQQDAINAENAVRDRLRLPRIGAANELRPEQLQHFADNPDKLRDRVFAGGDPRAGNQWRARAMTDVERTAAAANPEAFKPEAIAGAVRANEALIAGHHELDAANRDVIESEKQLLESRKRAAAGSRIDQLFAANTRDQERAELNLRAQRAMQSRSEDLLISGMRDPKDQAAYRAQKEFAESVRRSEEAMRLGAISPEAKAAQDKASLEKRDRDIREAKYGGMQADGGSGFQSADIKSTQGFNAAIKAMRYSEQNETIAELKKNGDIAAEQLASQQRVEEILKMAPIPMVDF